MKPILVPVDFSKPAENAARYAVHLCETVKSNLLLCHAFLVPAEAVGSAQIAWPLYEYSTLEDYSKGELEKLAKKLEDHERSISSPRAFRPAISCVTEAGNATDVISHLADDKIIGLIVMGLSGSGAVSRFFMGSVARKTLEKVSHPVLLIPKNIHYKMLKKIAFATDLNNGDIKIINSFVPWIALFGADLVITHIVDDLHDTVVHQKESDEFVKDIGNKINYDKLYFRRVESRHIDEGLNWIMQNGRIDMLAMVHHHKGAVSTLFGLSYTKEVMSQLTIPLLVFPEDKSFTL